MQQPGVLLAESPLLLAPFGDRGGWRVALIMPPSCGDRHPMAGRSGIKAWPRFPHSWQLWRAIHLQNSPLGWHKLLLRWSCILTAWLLPLPSPAFPFPPTMLIPSALPDKLLRAHLHPRQPPKTPDLQYLHSLHFTRPLPQLFHL